MFQNFKDTSDKTKSRERVTRLRKLMQENSVDGFLIPQTDEFHNEYLPESTQRLAWISGFTGSAGEAIVLQDSALLLVDSRYTLQARKQIDSDLFTWQLKTSSYITMLAEYLKDKLPKGAVIACDPRILSCNEYESLQKTLMSIGLKLVECAVNYVDQVWEDRPDFPNTEIVIHPIEYTGRSSVDKLADLRLSLLNCGVSSMLITSPTILSWLFNIRASDVQCTPLVLASAFVSLEGKAQLFVDSLRMSAATKAELENYINFNPVDSVEEFIVAFVKSNPDNIIGIDLSALSHYYLDLLKKSGARVKAITDPCELRRAKKNPVEIKGALKAHVNDAISVSNLLAWLDNQEIGTQSEISVVEKLESFRREHESLKDISFETISGFGANGAIVHYRVNEGSNKKIDCASLLLVDSGGQYLEGTTDITRTVAIGEPSAEMKKNYTLVLKGHLNLANARFPVGTKGSELDVLARVSLWNAGLNFRHGTGHGVGSYLSVHEGPQGISAVSKAPYTFVPLDPGMIVSNEPGYYKEGEYGIRIENLIYVQEASSIAGGEQKMLGFANLTKVPYCSKLIDVNLLSAEEQEYLKRYNNLLRKEILPLLENQLTVIWFESETAFI